MSFQYGTTINQNKEETTIHKKKLAKLYRIFWNLVGKKKYEIKKYTESIENHLYINIKIYDNVLYPEPKMPFINDPFNETENYHQTYTISWMGPT